MSHLPTWALVIGFIVYWIELYVLLPSAGYTSSLAPVLFAILAALVFKNASKKKWDLFDFKGQDRIEKALTLLGLAFAFFLLIYSLRAALLPPHLHQEHDAINYHMTLPRQHLIFNSFAHIEWSAADLFLMPVDYALAPYWFCTQLPNKAIHFIFLLGILGVASKLVTRLGASKGAKTFILFAILGSHFVGIQMGTAMLDLVICYLFLAAFDSFLNRSFKLAALEFAFYFWSKPLLPVQATVWLVVVAALVFILYKFGFKRIKWGFTDTIEGDFTESVKQSAGKIILSFTVFSICLAGPFMLKSLYYAGTPIFPVAGGTFVGDHIDQTDTNWQSIIKTSQDMINWKGAYGHGTSLVDFIKHFWLMAVPEKGVNNAFDYPMGLPYLLFILPFLVFLGQALRKKEIPVIALFIVVYWITWWFSLQQTRYLYIPVFLMFMIVLGVKAVRTRLCLFALVVALSLTSVSVFRAHRADLGKSGYEVLRKKDQWLVASSNNFKKGSIARLDFFDAAFADFPVDVINTESIFVLEH